MKKQFLILLLLSSLSAFGQKNFRDGYIIKQVGDTTYGQVAYDNHQTSSFLAHFRVSKGQPILMFEPKDLVGFGYSGLKSMESKLLLRIEGVKSRRFVEVIFKGKISLYRYIDDYIFEKENTQYLVYKRKFAGLKSGENRPTTSGSDIRTILTLLSDCQKIVFDQANFKIVDKHLIQILKDYHQCVNEDYQVFKENTPWMKFQFGLFAGANTSKIKFESTNQGNDFLVSGNFQNASSIFLGSEISISSPRTTDAYELVTGLQYMKTNYYGFSELNTPTGIERNDVVINIDKVIIPFGIRYTFFGDKIQPYLSLGVNFTSHSAMSMEWVSETIRDQLVISNGNQIPFDSKSSQFGLWGSIGIAKNLSNIFTGFMEIKFENSNGIVKTGTGQNFDLNSSITNLQILLGIRF